MNGTSIFNQDFEVFQIFWQAKYSKDILKLDKQQIPYTGC